MSTNRRRPAAAPRRPQVAGRPRAAASPGSEETAESALAVEERTGTRTADRPRTGPGRTEGTAPAPAAGSVTTAPGRDRDEPAPGTGSGTAPADDARDAQGAAEVHEDRASGDGASGDGSTHDGASRDEDRSAPELPKAAEVGGGAPAGDGARGGALARLRRIPLPSAPTSRRGTAALLAATVVLAAAAVFFAVSWFGMRFTGAATNTALTDVGTTAAVSEQVGDAVNKVYSFDFARLDQAEADARASITGPFVQQFDQIFGNVRQLAPKQHAVVTATIPKTAVASIEGDRATVYLFVNQVIKRVDDTGKPQEGGAAARLRVDAEYVDGRWKIAGMSPA